jgi:5-methylthioadenosine/S-adenosylhomocysteine deaminase
MLGLACPPALLPYEIERVTAAAKEEGFGIQMHIAEIAYEVQEWQEIYEASPFAVLEDLGLLDCHVLGGNVVFVTEEDLPRLRGTSFHASTCPKNCSKMALGMLDIPLLIENGINVCLGTNEVSCNNRQDMLEEARYAALYHKMRLGDPTVLGGDLPLRLITEQAGRALNTGVGVLAPGRPADLIILTGEKPNLLPGFNPLADIIYSASSADVRTVMVAGRVLMEEEEICVIDEPELVETLQEKARRWKKILPEPVPAGAQAVPYEMRWDVDRPEIKR